jgi:hypothetical protein
MGLMCFGDRFAPRVGRKSPSWAATATFEDEGDYENEAALS